MFTVHFELARLLSLPANVTDEMAARLAILPNSPEALEEERTKDPADCCQACGSEALEGQVCSQGTDDNHYANDEAYDECQTCGHRQAVRS